MNNKRFFLTGFVGFFLSLIIIDNLHLLSKLSLDTYGYAFIAFISLLAILTLTSVFLLSNLMDKYKHVLILDNIILVLTIITIELVLILFYLTNVSVF